jgi:hypothetical protein
MVSEERAQESSAKDRDSLLEGWMDRGLDRGSEPLRPRPLAAKLLPAAPARSGIGDEVADRWFR